MSFAFPVNGPQQNDQPARSRLAETPAEESRHVELQFPDSQCLVSFGSNLGNRDRLIAQAARILADAPSVDSFQASRLFETPPIGGPDGQEPFLNAVAAFNTNDSARGILQLLQQTEERLGRQRKQRWDARSIDLDVVLHGQLVGGGTGLIVPHPRYTARQFVLQPACDVAAHFRDPRFGWTLKRLAEHLCQGVPSISLVGGDDLTRQEICVRLSEQHGIRTFASRPLSKPMVVVGNAPAAVRRSPPGPPTQRGDPGKSSAPAEPLLADSQLQSVDRSIKESWVSAFVPPLPDLASVETAANHVPRLVARMQRTTAQTCWPAPHQMWPAGWRWPEYRLEIDDLEWAVSEVVSALTSMRCPVTPVTDDGQWWR